MLLLDLEELELLEEQRRGDDCRRGCGAAHGQTHVVVGHGNSGKIELIKDFGGFYRDIRASVGKYYEEGMMDFEMKPKVVADLAKYRDWHAFDERIGPYISQVIGELESESF